MYTQDISKIACSPFEVKNANVNYNKNKIIDKLNQARKDRLDLLIFSEYCLTGNCGGFFKRKEIQSAQESAIIEIIDASRDLKTIIALNANILVDDIIHSVILLIENKTIIGCIVNDDIEYKTFNYANQQVAVYLHKFYSKEIKKSISFFCGQSFSQKKYFDNISDINCILTSEAEYASRNKNYVDKYIKIFEKNDAINIVCNLDGDSVTNNVFTGKSFVSKGGAIAQISNDYFCVDLNDIKTKKLDNKPVTSNTKPWHYENQEKDIFTLQALALERRLKHIGANGFALGISGGLDSSYALLVCAQAAKNIGLSTECINAISMPGMGTSSRTKNNAKMLCEALNVTFREIPIKESIVQHFKDIDYDINDHSVTFENAQARERTQILFDISNALNLLFVGTGDLSEIALGWCTFGGDHMAQYNINSSLLKSQIRSCAFENSKRFKNAHDIIKDIIDTPVSPELLPVNQDGTIAQITENSIGPYELQDYFIYSFFENAMAVDEIIKSAKELFNQQYTDSELKYYLSLLIKRFFFSAFKRNCAPEGANITGLSLTNEKYKIVSDSSPSVFLDMINA